MMRVVDQRGDDHPGRAGDHGEAIGGVLTLKVT
jgi:hypothetical protein